MKRFFCVCLSVFALSTVFGSEKIKVACVGDSITYGARIENRNKFSYPAQLSKILGKRFDVVNFGVNGQTVLSKADYPYIRSERYKQALAYNPDIVIIKLGTNDSKSYNIKYVSEFEKDYAKIINSFKSLPSKPKIYICIPVVTLSRGPHIDADRLENVIIPLIKKIAKKHSLKTINLYPVLKGKPKYLPDAIHPNAEGAGLVAKKIADTIKRDFR